MLRADLVCGRLLLEAGPIAPREALESTASFDWLDSSSSQGLRKKCAM